VVSVYRSTYRHEEVGSIILHDNSKNEDKRRGWANWVDRKMGEAAKKQLTRGVCILIGLAKPVGSGSRICMACLAGGRLHRTS
jgi:hypothetical protein